MSDTAWLTEFPINPPCVHLNHAGLSPWPRRTAELIHAFVKDCHQDGLQRWPEWENHIQKAREAVATMLAVTPAAIAFTKNTSEAVSLIAYGLDWSPGDNIIVGRQEFPANRLPWESLQQSFGVDIHWVDYNADSCIEEALLARINRRTRLLTVSSIHYENGYRMDLHTLGAACRQNDVLFCVDAIQSLGATPLDAESCGIDFVCAGSHKWLLAPEGVGILYCRPEVMLKLKLNQYGWHMTSTPDHYNNMHWQLATDAQRFECGTMNTLGLCALDASLSLLLEVGIKNSARLIEGKVNYLLHGINQEHYEIMTPLAATQRGGILTFRHRHQDNRRLYSHLRAHGVRCVMRAGGIRLSPHFYNRQQGLDQVLSYLESWASTA